MIQKLKSLIPGSAREFLLPLIRERQCHAFCVGAMKTGTHSIAGLFKKGFRANHEPERSKMIAASLAYVEGSLSESRRRKFVQKRDRRLWLDMDSSVFNYPFVELYRDEFPDAKFVLTIRDCYSWLDSCFNHQLSLPIDATMKALLDDWFQPDNYQHTDHEQPMIDKGLFPLACYADFWNRYNSGIINALPKERLLIIKTNEIAESTGQLENFLGLKTGQLDMTRSHSFRAPEKHDVLAKLNQQFVADIVNETGGKLMSKHFST